MKGLSLDGGGLFGIGQAAILSQVDCGKFGFIAGTSVGSILASMIATKMDPSKCVNFFLQHGHQIFSGHWWRKYNFLFTPKYNDKNLNKILQVLFPGMLGDVSVPLFITAVDLNRRRLKVFCSEDPDDADTLLWEVVRMATAAETYFKPWNGFSDAGIMANNPAMIAVAGAVNYFGIKTEDLELCSIGTGVKVCNTNTGSTEWWSTIRWGTFVIQLMLNGGSNTMHEYFVKSLHLKKYYRVQFLREDGWKMDDPSVVKKALDAWKIPIEVAVRNVDAF